ENGGFGMSGNKARRASSSGVIHCLNGNLLRALLGFGWISDSRVDRAVEWQARSISGEGFDRYYRWGTSGPGFGCGMNGGLSCAFGATKALRALARIPAGQRSSIVEGAIAQ